MEGHKYDTPASLLYRSKGEAAVNIWQADIGWVVTCDQSMSSHLSPIHSNQTRKCGKGSNKLAVMRNVWEMLDRVSNWQFIQSISINNK